MKQIAHKFKTEEQLVTAFCRLVKQGSTPWGIMKYKKEFSFANGRVDIISYSFNMGLIAFEAKLENWRKAVTQAYKYTSFASLSYVLLPSKMANIAVNYKSEFVTRNVGLCSIADNNINIVIDAIANEPLFPWLQETAIINIGYAQ